MYGEGVDLPALEWSWVEERLAAALLYWCDSAASDWPHPRPVWGVWHRSLLCLSVGSPVLRRAISADGRVTVHLESATEVVLVEGAVVESADVDSAVDAYDHKYDYSYEVSTYGRLLAVAPRKVLAWTAGGPAGREGFSAAGAWSFTAPG